MNFYREIGRGLSSKKRFYTKKDVKKIADLIGRGNDADILDELQFELSGNEGSIFFNVWDVLNERYTYKKELKNYYGDKNLIELNKKIVDLFEFMAKTSLGDGGNSDQNDLIPIQELKILFRSLEQAKAELNSFFLDPASERKQLLKKSPGRTYRGLDQWSKDARYWLMIKECARLYERLSGKPFKCHFNFDADESDEFAGGLSEGVKFVKLLHDILNHMAKACSVEPFLNGTFATACKMAQKSLKADRVNQNH